MSEESVPVSIEILDKEYMVACPESEKEALLESARLLNDRMKQVRDSGKVYGTDRMAVITALNVIHEFAQASRERQAWLDGARSEVNRLADKVRIATSRRHAGDRVD